MDRERTVSILVTHSCNLKCAYCYEWHKDDVHISYDTAKQIIDNILLSEDKSKGDCITFEFFGGEPTLEFDLIKKIVEYSKTIKTTLKHNFFIPTNGTLLTSDDKLWLNANKDLVIVGLSLDGTKRMHDLNRCNSFDSIDIDFFLKTYPEQTIKLTISPQTLPMMSEGIIYCHKLGFLISCNLAYSIDWSHKKNIDIFSIELKKLADYYLDNPDIKPCSFFEYNRLVTLSDDSPIISRSCGAGWNMEAYDCDGTKYPCQSFMPITIGKDNAEQVKNLILTQDYVRTDVKSKCSDCPLLPACPQCYVANYVGSKNIYQCQDDLCEMLKIQIKACAYYVGKLFEKGRLDTTNEFNVRILKGVLKIQHYFEPDLDTSLIRA